MTETELTTKEDRPWRLFPRISKRVLQDNIDGWLFIAPILLSALVFTVYPIFRSLDLSFRDWNPLGQDTFIGLDNYRMLFQDRVFVIAMKNVLVYALYTIPAGLIWGMLFNGNCAIPAC